LVGQHQDNLSEVERAMQEAMDQAKNEEDRADAKQRAEALRRAVQDLPEPGQVPPDSDGAAAALAREHTNAMAQDIEGQDLQGAVDSARDALAAFEAAERRANGSNYLQEQLQRGKDEVKRQLEWAKQKLAEAQGQAAKQAAEGLKRAGAAEQELSRRASELANGDPAQVALPEQARQRLREAERLMDEAARKLAAGAANEAIELQRQAQRLLEESNDEPSEEPQTEGPPHANQSGGDKGLALGGDVPGDAQQRAEEFRRRVLEGLGKGREGPLAPAVKRYAEGLLQ
jgi:paraquat-inducible protein B